jgi:hypothetical protein
MTRKIGSGKLVIATHNAGKLKEIAALLAPHGVDCISAGSLGLAEPAETGRTFVDNALIKARAAAAASGMVALADDSGLSVAALEGRRHNNQQTHQICDWQRFVHGEIRKNTTNGDRAIEYATGA